MSLNHFLAFVCNLGIRFRLESSNVAATSSGYYTLGHTSGHRNVCAVNDCFGIVLCYWYSSMPAYQDACSNSKYMFTPGDALDLARLRLRASDAFVLNSGVHFSLKNKNFMTYAKYLGNFEEKVRGLMGSGQESQLPFLIWRETAAQHYSCPGGTFDCPWRYWNLSEHCTG